MAKSKVAELRERNAGLQPGEYWAVQEAWTPCVRSVMERLSVRGAEPPAGLTGGVLTLRHYMLAATGFVKWVVRYEMRTEQDKLIGHFVTDYLPDPDECEMRPVKAVKTHGKTMTVKGSKREHERQVRVLVDAGGQPVPIPVGGVECDGLGVGCWTGCVSGWACASGSTGI